MRTTVSPSDGPLLLLFAFEAVIIGGMGSFWGTFAGAMVLGLAQQIGFRLDPGWGIWFGHMVFLAVLVLRPQGLLPKDARLNGHRCGQGRLLRRHSDREPDPRRLASSAWRGARRRAVAAAGWSLAGLVLLAASMPLLGASRAGCASSSRSPATSSSR